VKRLVKFVVGIVLAVVLVIALKAGFDTCMDILFPLRHSEIIDKYCTEYDLDRYLVMGVIKAESNYIHDAHSGVARGLMQITDDTAEWIAQRLEIEFSGDDIENPEINIRMGCYYLDYLIEKYKDVDVALAAYNGGMGNVNKWLADSRYSSDGVTLDDIPFAETAEYVRRVARFREIYERKYGEV